MASGWKGYKNDTFPSNIHCNQQEPRDEQRTDSLESVNAFCRLNPS